jgi:hypothetical protein
MTSFPLTVGLVPGKWMETVSLIAIEQPALQHAVPSAYVNLEFH